MRVMFPLMKLIITKWLLVYVLEHKHNIHVIYFLSLTVWCYIFMTLKFDLDIKFQGVGQNVMDSYGRGVCTL